MLLLIIIAILTRTIPKAMALRHDQSIIMDLGWAIVVLYVDLVFKMDLR